MPKVRSQSSAARLARRNVEQWKKEKERERRRKEFQTRIEKAAPAKKRDWAESRKLEIEFRTAVLHGDLKKVEDLLQKGAYDIADKGGDWSALCAACSNGHAEIVRLLLTAGMDPDARDSFGNTPLMNAAIYGKTDIAGMLVEHGANPHERDAQGMTAKELAMKHGRDETAALLHGLEKG